MKVFSRFSLAAALGAALLSSVALGGAARAASFGAAAEAVNSALVQSEQAQFRGGRVGGAGRVGGVGRVGAGRVGGVGRVGAGRVGGMGRVGGGRGFARGGRGYYGGRGAGIAAGIAGAAIIGGILAAEAERNAYDPYYGEPVYGGPVYAPAPVYEEPVYVRPRNRNRTRIPYNPVRDPAGGGLTSGGY